MEEEEETIGETDRWGRVGVGEGEREERHGSQSAHTVKAGRSVPCPQRDTRTVAGVVVYLERGRGAFKLYSSLSPSSLPLILPLTPQHRVLIYKKKQKAEEQYESHNDLQSLRRRVRMSRLRQIDRFFFF